MEFGRSFITIRRRVPNRRSNGPTIYRRWPRSLLRGAGRRSLAGTRPPADNESPHPLRGWGIFAFMAFTDAGLKGSICLVVRGVVLGTTIAAARVATGVGTAQQASGGPGRTDDATRSRKTGFILFARHAEGAAVPRPCKVPLHA